MGENVVAAHLSATYSREVSHDAAVDMGLSQRPSNPHDIHIFASFWSGAFCTYPGAGNGNEAAEAIHSAWPRDLAELGGCGSVESTLPITQRLYNRWSSAYDWAQTRPLSPLPHKLDPALLNGTTLACAGRSTAFNFHKASTTQTVHIVFPQLEGSDNVAMSRSMTVRNSLQADIGQKGVR